MSFGQGLSVRAHSEKGQKKRFQEWRVATQSSSKDGFTRTHDAGDNVMGHRQGHRARPRVPSTDSEVIAT